MKDQHPQWQPLSMLPVFSDMVDGMLKEALAQRANLQIAVGRPHVLDDDTVKRLITLYQEQLEDHWLFEEQFARWQRESLGDVEAREVHRLIAQSGKLKTTSEEVLALAERIAPATIDKIMAMDDFELGLQVLTGQIKPPT